VPRRSATGAAAQELPGFEIDRGTASRPTRAQRSSPILFGRTLALLIYHVMFVGVRLRARVTTAASQFAPPSSEGSLFRRPLANHDALAAGGVAGAAARNLARTSVEIGWTSPWLPSLDRGLTSTSSSRSRRAQRARGANTYPARCLGGTRFGELTLETRRGACRRIAAMTRH